jgi:hypothetical protein
MIEKTTLQLRRGDRILWPEHDLGDGRMSRHNSGTVVDVEYDKANDGVVAKVVCTREWFNAGIQAVHSVEENS